MKRTDRVHMFVHMPAFLPTPRILIKFDVQVVYKCSEHWLWRLLRTFHSDCTSAMASLDWTPVNGGSKVMKDINMMKVYVCPSTASFILVEESLPTGFFAAYS